MNILDMGTVLGVVMAMSELVKRLELFHKKYIPLLNILLGVGFCLLCATGDPRPADVVMQGILVGLTASGLYSSVKNVAQAEIKN
jgi:hypothetical protein